MTGRQARRTQEERRDESEQRMLAAGVRLVAELGSDKLTLAEVGKAAGYSRGLPAHHFGSREEYLKALASYVTIEFERLVAPPDRSSGLGAVLGIVRAVLAQLQADPANGLTTQVVLADGRREQGLSPDVVQLRDRTLAILAGHIRDGMKAGEIRAEVAPEHASLLIAAAICGIIETWLADPEFDLTGAAAQLLDLIEHALATRS